MKLTGLLIALCVIGFVYPVLFVEDYNLFINEYGFSGENVVTKPWVLLTSIFLHADLMHLLSNVLVLFFFGIAVEAEIGKKMLPIFFLGAFLGDFLSILVYGFGSVGIGASAGVFALVGAGILLRPFDFSFFPLIVPVPLALVGIMYAIINVYGFITDPTGQISYIAHFGGLFVGLYFGFRSAERRGLKLLLLIFLVMILAPLIWLILL